MIFPKIKKRTWELYVLICMKILSPITPKELFLFKVNPGEIHLKKIFRLQTPCTVLSMFFTS